MKKVFATLSLFFVLLLIGVAYYAMSVQHVPDVPGSKTDYPQGSSGQEPIICTADAMQCPDGSYVGRSGPKCQFICPAQDGGDHSSTSSGQSVIIVASLGQTVIANNLKITPVQIMEDSRCPVDVTCIQAGTVAIMVRVEMLPDAKSNQKQTGAFVLKIGDVMGFGTHEIELVAVSPDADSKAQISDSDYRFSIEVLN